MYCIDTPGVPESSDACTFHGSYIVEPKELPPFNINAMVPLSMQYILKFKIDRPPPRDNKQHQYLPGAGLVFQNLTLCELDLAFTSCHVTKQ